MGVPATVKLHASGCARCAIKSAPADRSNVSLGDVLEAVILPSTLQLGSWSSEDWVTQNFFFCRGLGLGLGLANQF